MIKLTPEKPPYYENVEQNKIYKALLQQNSTNNPTVIILKNTIGNIIWTRQSQGYYEGTLTDTFPIEKTGVMIASTLGGIWSERVSDSIISINTTAPDGTTYQDGWLSNTQIQIEINS